MKGSLVRRHWFDGLVLGAFLFTLWVIWSTTLAPARRQVAARTELPAFHQIRPDDLDLSAFSAQERQSEASRYVGYFVKQSIPAGGPITGNGISSTRVDLSGTELLRVSLPLPPADPNRRVPYGATLILAAKKEGAPNTAVDVTVLAYMAAPTPAVVLAIRSEDVARLGPSIASSEAILLQPMQ